MPDQAQLIAQIRFALEQLSERNGQHEWEHLCRHLARERICSNILPATGPVQVGGDQGRDFETFRTFLSHSPLAGQSFVGLISDKPLAFACSLEQNIASKIRQDIATIMSSGNLVEGIYFFCTRGVPVARRHKLQAWTQATYDVPLEIFDGAAIAELLADREIFWIGERFLQLPSQLLPTLPDEVEAQDWYGKTQQKWRHETRQAQTFADFVQIRAAARVALGPFAYADDGHPVSRHERPELPFWIERLDEIAEAAAFDTLRRRALYEASVLRLRGLGSLIGQEARLRHFFAQIPELENAADLTDTQVLLGYVWPASRQELINVTEFEIEQWFQSLEQRLQDRLSEAELCGRLNEQCALLETKGHLAFNRNVMQGLIDPTATLIVWRDLAQRVVEAPLFPLEEFADRLAKFAEFIGVHPDYNLLAERIDDLVAERFGQFKVAEQCLKRAKAFHQAGELSRAMAQLHRAKIDWFAEETLGKSLLALDWLSRAYIEQGLLFAAKYYALAAAYVALHADDLRLKPAIAHHLERAASCDYAMGAWNGFLALADGCTTFYPHFSHDLAADFNDPNGFLNQLIFHLGVVAGASSLFTPALDSLVLDQCRSIAQRVGLDDVVDNAHLTLKERWGGEHRSQLWETMEEQLAGPPWSDAGPQRQVQWRAHGVTWQVWWANEYEMTLVSEQFLAALQIVLSDLAGYDLCLTRSTLEISLHLAPDVELLDTEGGTGYRGFDTVFEPSNDERRAIVTLPAYRRFRDGALSFHDLRVGALSVVGALLSEVSLLPVTRYYQMLEERFIQGLQDKLLIGASYGKCLREFVGSDMFDTPLRSVSDPSALLAAFTSRLPGALAWFDGDGPGYSTKASQEQIRNRYEGFIRPIGRTLRRLNQEPEFQTIVDRLRASGWKDWHILSAVFHATVNYRLNQRRILLLSPEAEMEATKRLTSQPEPENALIVPLSEYTEVKLRQQMPMYMLSFVKAYGLEVHQRTPDFAAIEDFVAQRYHFWVDDVEHDDPFMRESCEA